MYRPSFCQASLQPERQKVCMANCETCGGVILCKLTKLISNARIDTFRIDTFSFRKTQMAQKYEKVTF